MKVYLYTAHITSCLMAVFYNSILVRSDVSLLRRLWLPLPVHIWSHSPTQPMHEMWDETTDTYRGLRALLFPISVWVL